MKLRIILIALLAAFLGGCVAHAHGSHRIVTSASRIAIPNITPGIVITPPSRVRHDGKWLRYRSHAYYYRCKGIWVVASSVPSNVAHHHRPTQSERTATTERNDHENQTRSRSNHNRRARRQH